MGRKRRRNWQLEVIPAAVSLQERADRLRRAVDILLRTADRAEPSSPPCALRQTDKAGPHSQKPLPDRRGGRA